MRDFLCLTNKNSYTSIVIKNKYFKNKYLTFRISVFVSPTIVTHFFGPGRRQIRTIEDERVLSDTPLPLTIVEMQDERRTELSPYTGEEMICRCRGVTTRSADESLFDLSSAVGVVKVAQDRVGRTGKTRSGDTGTNT